MDTEPTAVPPNHHAHHPGFSGFSGLVAALSMRHSRTLEVDRALELAEATAGAVVLDIGCGPGDAVRRAGALGCRAIGVDPAPVMLRVARLADRRGGTYRVGRAEALPVDDGTVDAAIALATVHHWPALEPAVAEVARVLRPGGRFVAVERVADPLADGLESHGWSEAQAEGFADLLRAGGFVDAAVSQHPGSKGPTLFVAARRPG